MRDELHWGPFTLQWSMLSWIAAFLAGYGLIYLIFKRHKNEQLNNELLTIISNGLFTFMIVWKFGAVILDISIIWTRPLGLLLFTGGLQETYYGIIAACLIVLYSLRKRSISIRPLADALSWGIPGSVCVYQLFNLKTSPLSIYVFILAVVILLGLFLIKTLNLGSGNTAKWFCISFGLGMLLLSLFAQPQVKSLLTTDQIWFAAMVLSGLFSNPLLNFIDCSFIVHPNLRKERDSMMDPKEQDNGG
ncbi:hypothetical protein EHS13_28895 [Paenibacillus psychroresistens]|uniref:Prolipoprotein diacylglyceryl transferase n=1 Tax=Paenibacillus psychroresistens TaxID=1778678 RepID=A0A6B8RS25_9BACL|nr:hypothetical protein [Paenibacillus psychroresistens]QGQ98614.1 hypothetical protein EHS13_28895 [Paenibacillus psychroresistens]